MLVQTSLSVHSAAAIGRSLSRASFKSCTCASYASTRHLSQTTPKPLVFDHPRTPSTLRRTLLAHRSLPSTRLGIRFSSAGATVAPTSSDPSASHQPQTLTWNRFLALRKTRRRISLVASILCAGGSTAGGLFYLSTADLDKLGQLLFGLDPLVVLGLSTITCGLAGWLVGPFFGNGLFRLYYRGINPQIAAKEKEFFARIKKHRVDPSSSSIANPVPDFYGEKIGSVTDYRRWLKDQRAFNLKRGRTM